MKKVLLLVAGDNGTIGSCSLNLYEALKANNTIEVRCAVIHHFDNGYSGFSDAIFFDKENKGGLKSQIKWLKGIKRNFRPDVTISTLFGVSTLSVLSGGSDRKVGIFHSPYWQMKAFGKKAYLLTLFQYNFIYPCLDKLCCVSQEVLNSLSVFPAIHSKKKEVVYNVHNLTRIRELANSPIIDDREISIFNNPTLVYCGRLDSNKSPDRALKAFAMAKIPGNSQLVFIGEDQERLSDGLKIIAKELGVENRVHFLGRKSNPYPYFRAAGALISSSYSEGLPGVMIESLALGTPVVATNSSMGIWEIFSCLEDYDSNLDDIYSSDCGYISSNLASRDKTKYDVDIDNLAKAIELTLKKDRNFDFLFANKVGGFRIVSQLLNSQNH